MKSDRCVCVYYRLEAVVTDRSSYCRYYCYYYIVFCCLICSLFVCDCDDDDDDDDDDEMYANVFSIVLLSKIMCIITHADGSRVSIALIRLRDSVCVSVCLSVCLSAW